MATKRIVGTSVVKIEGDNKGLTKSLNDSRSKIDRFATKAKGAMRGFDKKIRGAFKSFGIGAAVLAAAATGIVLASKKAVEALDKIGKGARNLGIASDSYQELAHVAEITGVGIDLFAKSFAKLQRASEDAKDGLTTNIRAFDKMGISVKELEGLSPEGLLERVADGMRTIKDPTQQAAVAMQLFGSRGLAMLEAMKLGSVGIRDLRVEARKLGLVIDKDLIDSAEKSNDTFSTMKKIVDLQWVSVWAELAPTIIELSQGFLGLAKSAAAAMGVFKGTAIEQADRKIEKLSKSIEHVHTQMESFIGKGIAFFNPDHLVNQQKRLAGLEEELANVLEAREKLNVLGESSGNPKDVVEKITAEQAAYIKLIDTITKDREAIQSLIIDQGALREAFANGAITLDEFNDKLAENERKLGVVKEKVIELENTPLDKMFDSVNKIGEQFETAFVSGIDKAAASLTEFSMTGATDVKAMAKSIIADLIKIQIRAALISGIGAAFPGLSFTGAGTTTAPVPARAAGGPVSAGLPFLVGEKGPEIMVPKQSGTILPNSAIGGAVDSNVVVNVENAGTPQDVEQANVRASADGFIVDIVLSDLNRGGPMSQGFSRRFGLNRR